VQLEKKNDGEQLYTVYNEMRGATDPACLLPIDISSGLIINEAIYLPLDQNGEPITDLGVNVTDVLQALVHNGQVFIPGNRPKVRMRATVVHAVVHRSLLN
jgi:hypothetical protein